MCDRKRIKLSGAQYRKAKEAKIKEKDKLKGSLEKFLKSKESVRENTLGLDDDLLEPCTSGFRAEETNLTSFFPFPTDMPSSAPGTSTEDHIETGENSEVDPSPDEDGIPDTSNILSINFEDPAHWKFHMTDNEKQVVVDVGPISGEKPNDNDYPSDGNARHFSNLHFYRILSNGERLRRQWLLYSNSKNLLFCFCCKLFSTETNRFITGYNDWRNVGTSIAKHERSTKHKKVLLIGLSF